MNSDAPHEVCPLPRPLRTCRKQKHERCRPSPSAVLRHPRGCTGEQPSDRRGMLRYCRVWTMAGTCGGTAGSRQNRPSAGVRRPPPRAPPTPPLVCCRGMHVRKVCLAAYVRHICHVAMQAAGAPEVVFLPLDAPVWAFATPIANDRLCMVVTGATIAQARGSRSVHVLSCSAMHS